VLFWSLIITELGLVHFSYLKFTYNLEHVNVWRLLIVKSALQKWRWVFFCVIQMAQENSLLSQKLHKSRWENSQVCVCARACVHTGWEVGCPSQFTLLAVSANSINGIMPECTDPGRLNLLWWCLISLGPQYGTSFMSPLWHLEFWGAARLLENLWISDVVTECQIRKEMEGKAQKICGWKAFRLNFKVMTKLNFSYHIYAI
jgi:hypothetical protein